MSDARNAFARDMVLRLGRASHDELRVLERVLRRLELGRERYGALNLSKPRDWRIELADELLDAVVYDTMDTIRAEDQKHAEEQAAIVAEFSWEEQ